MKRFEVLLEDVLARWAHLPSRVLRNGTRLIGHIPQRAENAFLFRIFPGLLGTEIILLEAELEMELPGELREFFVRFNGLSLFADSLALYGLRLDLGRSIESVLSQPFRLRTPNIEERPEAADSREIFLGGYNFDGSLVHFDRKRGTIVRTPRGGMQALNEWNSFDSFLALELERLGRFFDRSGTQDFSTPSTP